MQKWPYSIPSESIGNSDLISKRSNRCNLKMTPRTASLKTRTGRTKSIHSYQSKMIRLRILRKWSEENSKSNQAVLRVLGARDMATKMPLYLFGFWDMLKQIYSLTQIRKGGSYLQPMSVGFVKAGGMLWFSMRETRISKTRLLMHFKSGLSKKSVLRCNQSATKGLHLNYMQLSIPALFGETTRWVLCLNLQHVLTKNSMPW